MRMIERKEDPGEPRLPRILDFRNTYSESAAGDVIVTGKDD